ncbi:MAG: class I SAM-dependent methyltransferase [Aquabacterium sp.]|nr:class I SAM-dependent methyltransferase [Aquabacterium sp.]
MFDQLRLGMHFVLELAARRYEYDRVPEPDLVMDNPDNVREYRDAGLATGNGSSVYLYNLLLLSGAIKPKSTVVDLACGPANLLVELAIMHPDAEFIGVDLSAEMLACATELKTNAGVRNVRFVCGDITKLDMFADRSADIVMSTLSIHHLPEKSMLAKCFGEIARIVRPGGHVHLMDFASLKREATARYFVHERTRGLGAFLTRDYENSLRAAFRLEDFAALLPILQSAAPETQLRTTFGVPFMVALTSINSPEPDAQRRRALATYWSSMQPAQRADFSAMRLFFSLGGLKTPHPKTTSG